ncbi:MAG: hypothetical protein KDJ14_10510 [Xanthomonadales bacterium]|nr:hypothetical protein [Xanthomonadales bacterium]
MSLDKRLLEILCCPESKQPVHLLDAQQLDRINRAQHAGALNHLDGSAVAKRLDAGLLTADGRRVYPVEDGIPVMLVDQAISTAQIEGFENAR